MFDICGTAEGAVSNGRFLFVAVFLILTSPVRVDDVDLGVSVKVPANPLIKIKTNA